ncbi:MAG TPA: peptidoglycan glycosyltransferase, partial [Saprospiraceae bacterium]|nr:peptidoglycan glycosyltransferase [Saprospiraceae bacterium]
LINNPLWQNLVSQYNSLQDSFKKEFNRPVKMLVYDYNKGEKDTIMSPLDSVRYHKMFLQSAMLVVEPNSGYVKAWVGGINHKYFKYDHVTMRRSVGSTIKPFVYTQAMAVANISPCQEFDDIQYTISPSDSG